jgi:tetratricopeptide (TPR) repeat protein
MKKILLTVTAVLHLCIVNAQKSKGFDAQSYLRDYNSTQDITSLNHAKESIDAAAENAETKDNPFILVTKGQIYMALYDYQRNEIEKTLSSIADIQKRALAVYESTPTGDLETAYQAFYKAKQVDIKGKYSDETKTIMTIGTYFDYSGRAKFNVQKYNDALGAFERAYEISNNADTTVLYLAAISADYSGNFTKAKQYYGKMVETKQARPNTYTSLVNTYYALKDTAGGIEMLRKGREAFPNNANLLLMDVNNYLKKNKGEELLNNLNTAIIANPTNVNLYLARGNVYDNIAAHFMSPISDTTKQNQHTAAVNAAEADYLKVITADSNNYYALFNLGILYFNKAVLLNNTANDIADNLKFKALNTKANEDFNKSMPLLERALKQQPNEHNLMIALKQVYARLQLEDKLEAINEKLKQ